MGTHYRGAPEVVRALDAYIKLMRCARSVSERADDSLRSMGFTESQFGVLEMLLHLGPLHQHIIGEKLLLSRANITLLVDQLARRRLVRRERDREDRRRVLVQLTPEGRRKIERLFPSHARHLARAFSILEPAELVELSRLCRKLGRTCRPPVEDGAGPAAPAPGGAR